MWLLEVLEHLVDPALAIGNWKMMLKTGGILFIRFPTKKSYSRLCIHCNRKTPVNAHLHSWDVFKLASLLSENGFEVLKVTLFSHKLLSALALDKKLQKMPYTDVEFPDKLCGTRNDKYNYLAVKAIRQDG